MNLLHVQLASPVLWFVHLSINFHMPICVCINTAVYRYRYLPVATGIERMVNHAQVVQQGSFKGLLDNIETKQEYLLLDGRMQSVYILLCRVC